MNWLSRVWNDHWPLISLAGILLALILFMIFLTRGVAFLVVSYDGEDKPVMCWRVLRGLQGGATPSWHELDESIHTVSGNVRYIRVTDNNWEPVAKRLGVALSTCKIVK